jgi:thymidylate synthase ThyX
LAYDESNLVTLHQSCHHHIHSGNLELEFARRLQRDISFDISLKQNQHKSGLLPHGHATPRLVKIASIEYVGEIDMYDLVVDGPYPNFVANWFIVHNSGRYVAFEEDDFYTPSTWRKQSSSNKQASLGELTLEEGAPLSEALAEHYARGYQLYRQALDAGVARELARVFLPAFAVYYTWVAKVDAHNLMHFLHLRMADEAQYEIRAYARAIYEHFFKPALPWTAEAFETLVLNAPSP